MLKRERNAAPLNSPFLPSCKKFQVQFESNKNERDGREYEALGIFDHVFQEHHQHQFGAVVATECAEALECVGFLGYLNLNAAFLQHPVTVKFSSQAIFLEPTGYGSAQHSISVLSHQAK